MTPLLRSHLRSAPSMRNVVIGLMLTAGSPVTPTRPAILRIVATNYAFRLPARIGGGPTTLRLVNAGTEPHYALFYRLAAGKTSRDFVDWRASRTAAPPWLTILTGPGPVMPGDSTDVTLFLDNGHYLVICGYPGTDRQQHVDKGMLQELDVAGSPSSGERSVDPPPNAAVVRLADSSFALTRPVAAGRHTVVFENRGSTVKQGLLVRLPDGVSLEDEKRWFDTQFHGPRPGLPSGGVLRLAPGERVAMTRDFSPGRWAVLSHAGGPWQTLEFRVAAKRSSTAR
jgi:hypothetical protein